MDFGFKLLHAHRSDKSRIGRVMTAHGAFETPAFMPVGTQGTVKGCLMRDVRDTGAGCVLGNTYHLMLRPGAEQVHALGGLQKFSVWNGPMLTDSGGFQVMSLARLRKVTEDGVEFQSHIDGSRHMLTPERAMDIQALLGSDIHMQLDECVRLPASYEEQKRAMELSLRWAERSLKAFRNHPLNRVGRGVFGIVQGGDHPDLRIESARALVSMGFDGYAIGGLAVGEPQDVMLAMLDAVMDDLPTDKPRYLMGVGTPDDLRKAIMRGVDMFDCVMPTREGRHGIAYSDEYGRVNLKNACFRGDERLLSPSSQMAALQGISLGYVHHLFKANEQLGPTLLSLNNLDYYQKLVASVRTE